jgi:sigma-B regulation protein RsbU (phosphoserine phosphatase)
MAFLRVVKESGVELVELTGPVMRAGRAVSNDLRLDDPAASREHFELRRVGNGYFIRDLGSRNGTLVNGVPLRQELMLLPGDEVTVGRTRFTLVERASSEPTAADPGTLMFEAEELSRSFLSEAETHADPRSARSILHLSELARDFLAESDEVALLERLAGRMLEVFRADRCAVVYSSDDPSGVDVRALACARPELSRQVRISTTAARRVLDEKMAFLLTDVASDERFRMQHSVLDGQITSILCAPLWHGSSVFGLLYVDTAGRPGALGKDELALLSAFANLAAIKIDNLRLVAASIASARMERDLALAAEIQARMLPQERFVFPGFDCCGFTRPCYEVGGDYFDFLPLSGPRFCFTVADVSGKGASGALLMASVKAMLTALVETGVPLLERVVRLNRHVRDNSTPNKFVTMFHAEVDGVRGTLRYCNAGHNPPVLLGADGSSRALGATGPVLGLLQLPYRVEEAPFPPGSLVLAYSDGVTEATNPADEEYGSERLLELVSGLARQPLDAVRDGVLEAVHLFTAGAPQHDDVTLVCVRRQE